MNNEDEDEWAEAIAMRMLAFPPEEVVRGGWRCEEHLPREHLAGVIDSMLASAAAGDDGGDALPRAPGSSGALPLRVRLQTTHFDGIKADKCASAWVRAFLALPAQA